MSPVHVPLALSLATDPRWSWDPGVYVRFREKATPEMRARREQHRWMFGVLETVLPPRVETVGEVPTEVGRVFVIGHILRSDPDRPNQRLEPSLEAVPFVESEIDICPELDFASTLGSLVQRMTSTGLCFKRTTREVEGGRAVITWKVWRGESESHVGRAHFDALAAAVALARAWGLPVDIEEPSA